MWCVVEWKVWEDEKAKHGDATHSTLEDIRVCCPVSARRVSTWTGTEETWRNVHREVAMSVWKAERA